MTVTEPSSELVIDLEFDVLELPQGAMALVLRRIPVRINRVICVGACLVMDTERAIFRLPDLPKRVSLYLQRNQGIPLLAAAAVDADGARPPHASDPTHHDVHVTEFFDESK